MSGGKNYFDTGTANMQDLKSIRSKIKNIVHPADKYTIPISTKSSLSKIKTKREINEFLTVKGF